MLPHALRRLLCLALPFVAFVARAGTPLTYDKLDTVPRGFVGNGALVEGRDGVFYGRLDELVGEPDHRGAVYRLAENGRIDVLHEFHHFEGLAPSGLVPGADGKLYGSAEFGGENQTGTFFRIDPATGDFRKLRDFPLSFVQFVHLECLGPDEAFYGIVGRATGAQAGAFFRATRAGGLDLFATIPDDFDTGPRLAAVRLPSCLVLGSDGDFYGTTQSGGESASSGVTDSGHGVFFRLTADGDFSVVAHFSDASGFAPRRIVEGADGAFYGLCGLNANGLFNGARLVRMNPAGGAPTVIQEFAGLIFEQPGGSLTASADGTIFGFLAGPAPGGILFSYTPGGVAADTLFTFNGDDGLTPGGALTCGADGVLRGVTMHAEKRDQIFRFTEPVGALGNHAPIARDDTYRIPRREIDTVLALRRNDTDLDGDKFRVTDVTEPLHGMVEIDDAGKRVLYTPDPTDRSADRFTYTIDDDNGGTATAEVRILAQSTGADYNSYLRVGALPAYVRVHVSASEGFTGNLLLAGRRFILRGTFDDTGEFMHTESTFYYDEDSDPVNGDVAITLTHNPGETTLGITVDFGGNSADETIPASPTSTELTGPYALVLPVESASARRHRGPRRVTGGSLPGARPATLGGVGSGYFKMESNATTRIVLRLADGLTASFGGALVTADVLPVFVNLYPQRHSSPPDPGGFFGGFLTFRKVAHVSDGDGDFHWTRPTRGGASVFDAGFAIIQPVKVVKYIPFHETRPPLRIYVDPPENATIALSGGGLLNDEFVPGDFGPSHVDAPVLRLSLDAAWRTGLCIGKFLHPALGRDVPMQGVIDRKGARIIGAFFTPAGSGTFSIEAKLGDVDP